MNSPEISFLPLQETYWRGIILALSGGAIFITVWCLSNGITTIFMHLYYFPIVLLAYHYRWKGCGLSTLLALAYLGLVAMFNPGQTEVILGAFYRFLVFMGIAAVIAAISERLVQVQDNLKNTRQFEESVIANAYVWISVLAPNGILLVWNDAAEAISGYKKGDVVGKNTVWKQLYPDNAYRKKVTIEIKRIIGRDTLLENFETEIRCADGSIKTIVWNTRSQRDAEGKVNGYITIGRDITKQIRAEAEIRHLASFPQLTPVNIIETDLGGRILFINPAMENTLAALGISDPGLFIPVDFLEKAASEPPGTQPAHQERELVIHGSTFTLNLAFVPESRSVRVYATDITIRKKTEKKLSESERKFREIFNNINDAVHLHELAPDGRPGRFLDVNDAACQMLMVSRDELLAHSPLDYATEYHNPPIDEVTFQLRTHGSATFETGHRRSDGVVIPVEINAHIINLMGKTVVLSVIRDLTYRKKAEEALRVSNVILSTQQETSPDGILIVDENARILDYNQRFIRIWGIPDDLITSQNDEPVLQYVVGQLADPETFLSRVRYLYDHKEEKSHEEILLKDARMLERYSAPMFGEGNRYFGRIWYFRDITDRKRAEEALRESEERFRGITERISDLIFIVDADGYTTFMSPSVTSILGFPPESYSGKKASLEIIHKEDIVKIGRAMESLKKGSPAERVEFRMLKRDGSYAVFDGTGTPVYTDEMYAGVQVVARDVTENKRVEAEIKRSMELFRTIMDSIDALIYVADMQNYELLFINKYGRDVWGGDVEGKVCWQIMQSGQDGPCSFCTNKRLVDKNGNPTGIYNWEFRNTVNDRWYDCRDSAIPWLDGRLVRIEVAIDISERKRAEEAIRESRQLFADIISFLPDPTFVIDRDGKVLAWNRALEQISGISAGDIVGKGGYEYSLWLYGIRCPILIDLVLHPDQDVGGMDYTNIHSDGRTVTAQTEIARPGSGHKMTLSLIASPLIDSQGKITGAIESMRDISRLREAEAELVRINQNLEKIVRERTSALEKEVVQRLHAEKDVQSSLNYTRSVIEANPDLMIVLDGTGTILDVNIATEMLAGIPRNQLIGTKYFQYLVDDGTHIDDFSRLLEDGRIEKIIHMPRKDGNIIPLAVNATVIAGGTGMDLRIIVSGHDITRQKQDEEAIRASLEEKVILLREVHHRVKNNLQIIISLTSLQMRQTNVPEVKQILSETQNRVRAMSLVHEKLYRSESLSQIDFADYTRFLASQLFSYYRTDSQRVQLELAIGKIMMDINTAVPLGLLMNELVSNALKHAFPQGREGTISISSGEADDCITLFVRDNGIGIPMELDWRNTTSLGMRLIAILIDQLNGTIELVQGEGTTFEIKIPKNFSDKTK
jgi:PAS domain S-box-containing protein